MASQLLTDSEIQSRIVLLPAWTLADGKLRRAWRFADFSTCFAFMTRVALLAERFDHHPDWSNSYDKLVIELVSHDVGGLTVRDFELAAAIQAL